MPCHYYFIIHASDPRRATVQPLERNGSLVLFSAEMVDETNFDVLWKACADAGHNESEIVTDFRRLDADRMEREIERKLRKER